MASLPMFGCLSPGRLVQFNAQQVSENQVVFALQDCEHVNHVVIFLTGSQPLPNGFVGSIYLYWPKPAPVWYFLGFISNEKPSVIYKIAKPKEGGMQNLFPGWQPVVSDSAQIGIAIEAGVEVLQKTPSGNPEVSNISSFVEFTQKMLNHVFNYCSSFGVTQSQMTMQPNETFVPLSALQKWYETFQRKMSMDPNFWKSL